MPVRPSRDPVQRVPGEGRRSENLQGRKPRAMERGAADARLVDLPRYGDLNVPDRTWRTAGGVRSDAGGDGADGSVLA
jgi:hypothetical protein